MGGSNKQINTTPTITRNQMKYIGFTISNEDDGVWCGSSATTTSRASIQR
jgi:hypothetical protein